MSSMPIAQYVDTLREQLIAIRRDFHMYPELSGEEKRTAGIVTAKLLDLGLEVTTGVGGHGVIGLLQGKQTGPVVAWRADMDAFTSDDTLDVPYRSRVPGVKHVCGHDVHTTIGLGIAEVLVNRRAEIAGTIKFIFQPAEENATGAHAMILGGALENPRPEAIFGLHVAPLPIGTIGSVAGMILPGITEFHIDYEYDSVNQSDLETLTQKISKTLSSLNTIPMDFDIVFNPEADLSSFVTVFGLPVIDENNGRIKGIQGFVRAANEALHLKTGENIQVLLNEILEDSRIKFSFSWPEKFSLPATINDKILEKRMRRVISNEIGQNALLLMNSPVPFNSEDFAWYLQQIPGVFYWLGVANEARGIQGMPHTPNFDVDEECILVGTRVMANLLLAYLARTYQ